MRSSSYMSYLSTIIFLVLCAAGSPRAQNIPDNTKIWTAVGSTGILDKSGATTNVFFAQSAVQIGTATSSGGVSSLKSQIIFPSQNETAVLRYNVTPVDGLFDPFLTSADIQRRGVQLKLRYLAVNAQVIAKLFEVDVAAGFENPRLIFDSNSFAAADGYHVDEVDNCHAAPFFHDFDFTQNAYYIEVILTHNILRTDSAAGIQIIQLIRCAPPPQQ